MSALLWPMILLVYKFGHFFIANIYEKSERYADCSEHDVHRHNLRWSHFRRCGEDRVVAKGGCDHDERGNGSLDLREKHVAHGSYDLKQSACTGPTNEECTCNHQCLVLSHEHGDQCEQAYNRVDQDETNIFDLSGEQRGDNKRDQSTCGIPGLHDRRICPADIFFCKVLSTVQPQLESTGAGESDQDHSDGFKGKMRMFQSFDQTLFFAACFLVRIRKREEKNKHKQCEVNDTAADEKRIVGIQSGIGGSYCNAKYERQEHLGDRDKKFDAHGSNTGCFVNDLGNCRVDTGVKEGIGDTADDCAYVGDHVAAVCAGAECEGKADQIDRVGGTSDCCGNAAPQLIRERSGERKGNQTSKSECCGNSCDGHCFHAPGSSQRFFNDGLSEDGAADAVDEIIQVQDQCTWQIFLVHGILLFCHHFPVKTGVLLSCHKRRNTVSPVSLKAGICNPLRCSVKKIT